eukprot:9462581-Karenia_brevis.AAC.1
MGTQEGRAERREEQVEDSWQQWNNWDVQAQSGLMFNGSNGMMFNGSNGMRVKHGAQHLRLG